MYIVLVDPSYFRLEEVSKALENVQNIAGIITVSSSMPNGEIIKFIRLPD